MADNSCKAGGPELQLLERLVRCKSVTPDDAGCQDILAESLTALGFNCESMPFGDVSNLWARRGTTDPLLCFAGHTDVVPPGNTDDWATDPFEPVIREGKLYGRGSADMKGSLAAMIPAAPERVVTTSTLDTASASALRTEPPLKPNQPNQRRKAPTAAKGMLCPMMGFTVL